MFGNPVPFHERENSLQRPLELLTGRYPAFLFGARVGAILPVFTFREVTLPYLETHLVYLMENGYRTLGADETAAFIRGELNLREPAVALHFDNTWASVWTVAAPLLRRYNMQATAFAIPGRVQEAETLRPVWGQPGHDPDVDHSQNPFCTWSELRALAAEGRISIQSNTWSHGKIFCSDRFERLILPETVLPLLSWPILSDPHEPLRRLSSSSVFHPLLPVRSRLSDALKHDVDPSVVQRIHDDPNAAPYLFRQYFLQIESQEDRDMAIRWEIHQARDELASRLKNPVRHLALPWGISGQSTRRLLQDSDYETVYADRVGGYRAAVPGQNPHRIMRLDHPFLRCLPGRNRKLYWRVHR
jgi:hypothetical protein